MGQTESVPGQSVSSPTAAELRRKWILRMRRSSTMAVTDSGYPEKAAVRGGRQQFSKKKEMAIYPRKA